MYDIPFAIMQVGFFSLRSKEMRICKQVKDIQGETLKDLKDKLNEALLEGAEIVAVDIQSLTALITVTEYVGEIEKTELDLLEEEFGCHSCEECPFFEESTDKRRKWHTCKEGKRVQKTSRCCPAYYETIRKEVKSEISEDKRENGLLRCEGRGCSGMAEGIESSGLRPLEWEKQVPTIGTRIPLGILKDTAGRTIQGGERC